MKKMLFLAGLALLSFFPTETALAAGRQAAAEAKIETRAVPEISGRKARKWQRRMDRLQKKTGQAPGPAGHVGRAV